MQSFDINQIRNLLPHRYPFLLLDRVVEVEKMSYIKAIKNVTVNEPFFQGHFPSDPIMPGVMIVEAMAQAAAILGEVSMDMSSEDGVLYYLAGVDDARFRRIVRPGDQLLIHVDYVTVKRNIWKFSASARVGDKVVASANLLTTLSDNGS